MRSVDRLYLTHVYTKMAMAAGATAGGSMSGGMGKVTGGLGGGIMKGTGSMMRAGAMKAPGMGGMGVAKALGQGSGRHGSLTGGGVMGPGGGFKNTAAPGVGGPLAGGRPTVNIQPKAKPVTRGQVMQQAQQPVMQPGAPAAQQPTMPQPLQQQGFQNTAQNSLASAGTLRPMTSYSGV